MYPLALFDYPTRICPSVRSAVSGYIYLPLDGFHLFPCLMGFLIGGFPCIGDRDCFWRYYFGCRLSIGGTSIRRLRQLRGCRGNIESYRFDLAGREGHLSLVRSFADLNGEHPAQKANDL